MSIHKVSAFSDGTGSDAMQSFYNTVLLMRGVYPLIAQTPTVKRTMAQRSGHTMLWRRYESLGLATTPLTEAVTKSGRTKTKTDLSARLRWYGDFIENSDELLLTQPEAIDVEDVELLGQQMGETFDKLYMNEWATQTTNVLYANGSATNQVNTIVDFSDFNRAYRQLKNGRAKTFQPTIMASQNVGTGPVMASYWALVDENMMFDIRAFTGSTFLLASEYARSQGVLTGEAGALKIGIRFLVTPEGEATLGGGASGAGAAGHQGTGDDHDVYSAFVCGMGAMGGVDLASGNSRVIHKDLGSGGTADPLDQRKTVGWKVADARELLNENFVTEIQSAVST